MDIGGAHRMIRARTAAICAVAMLGPAAANAFDVPEHVSNDPIAHSSLPLELRARNRAIETFNAGSSKKKHRYKWAGRPTIVLKYERPLQLMNRDMIFEVKVPGKHGAWARFRLKF
jgi:hypothetical protein